MYQPRKANFGEVHAPNAYGGQCNPSHSTDSSNAVVGSAALDWMGPRAFKTRYGVQPGVDRDFGMRWGPRHDQRVSHRRDTLDSPTGLLYAYDLTWDEYAVLATDVPWAAVEAVINHALARDTHMSAEAIGDLLADHLAVRTPGLETSTELATGVEL
jgi:hypothetical protein